MLALLQLLLVVEISYTLNHVKNLVFFCTKSSLLLHQVSEIENRGFIFFFFYFAHCFYITDQLEI